MKILKTTLSGLLLLAAMKLSAQHCVEPTAATYLHDNDIRAYISNSGEYSFNRAKKQHTDHAVAAKRDTEPNYSHKESIYDVLLPTKKNTLQ